MDAAKDVQALPSFISYVPGAEEYAQDLAQRAATCHAEFEAAGLLQGGAGAVPCEVHASAPSHYRQRVGFGIYDCAAPEEYRLKLQTSDAEGERERRPLRYVYWHAGEVFEVADDDFPLASRAICALMPRVLRHVTPRPVLRTRLRCVKYLSAMSSGARGVSPVSAETASASAANF